MTTAERFAKYDVPIPRYTSYPTVPQWHQSPSAEDWTASLRRAAARPDAGLAVYIHVPFCESLCTFCGCNTIITRDHGREGTYIDTLLAELDTYIRLVPELAQQPFRQLHLGGGTPTFLSSASLARLIDAVRDRLRVDAVSFEGSIEVDPRVTSAAQLETLRERGFRRVSMGVQDIDADVQHLVNRKQPLELTARLFAAARQLDYASINLDLIYGLPGQTRESMAVLAREIVALGPDRLAVYGFARVPWIKPQQRRFRDDQIPVGADKRALYEAIREPLLDAGYLEIGMDHFARPSDTLATAAAEGRLHRNFMGYTEVHTTTLLGLGVSAISDTPDCYHQNEKLIGKYTDRVSAGEIPTHRGHLLSDDDRRRRDAIASLMTTFRVDLRETGVAPAGDTLQTLVADEVVRVDGDVLSVPLEGRAFLRNAAALFDAYLAPQPDGRPLYSSSV
ncbi:MAG TPA: oxygen-independent coproporphyrinogen III oxidase [Vicinamibacterales bacterium]|jgi:oxygen-independent coproporphyrinogen-3 oxidase|nr:oxygen-independent coproporphyrinogen III oxidase [Vicinamibacterales bacterium]